MKNGIEFRRLSGVRRPLGRNTIAAVFTLLCFGSATAGYIGESFVSVPGVSGSWEGESYKGWVKFEARDWPDVWRDPNDDSFCAARRCSPEEQLFLAGQSRYVFRGPVAQESGAGRLALALDKQSPDYKAVMDLCRAGDSIPKVIFAESSDLARVQGESGERPKDVPDFFEYELRGVQLECPAVENAPEQAIVLSFDDISLLNYEGDRKRRLPPAPAQLPPLSTTGESRTFIVSWVSSASDNHPDECPELNREPREAEYFALLSPAEAAKARVELEQRGGLATLNSDIAFRGPEGLNVCALPGVVPDPGHVMPQSDIARGFNLDGTDGSGGRHSDVPLKKHFVSGDGRRGIDNQHYLIDGCIPGFKRNGNFTNIRNQHLRTGAASVLVHISGIDDLQNDDEVSVTVLYSDDRLITTAEGDRVLPDFTFRISDAPEWTNLFTHFDARIEDGVIVTSPVAKMTFRDGGQMAYRIHDARMRIELGPDGDMKAVLGGYQDWRILMSYWGHARVFEPTMRYQCPGMYNAFKRAADGMKNPVTGAYDGISVAYDIEGVPAFIPENQLSGLYRGIGDDSQKSVQVD